MGSVEKKSTESGATRKRCLDRRRETSRFAARDRRGKEADIFLDLKDVVPIVDESTTTTHIDRIALLRMAATLCRMRRNTAKFLRRSRKKYEGDIAASTRGQPLVPNCNIWTENSLTECMDGFVIIADSDGTILYVTESVALFLGLTQTDLVGHHIKEFVHHDDYDELSRKIINSEVEGGNAGKNYDCETVLRMKSVISPRGRNLNLKSALYKAIMCRCRYIGGNDNLNENDKNDEDFDEKLTLIHGCSTPAGQGTMMNGTGACFVKCNDIRSEVFTTRHTCDMRFTYVSENLNFLLRRDTRSLMGTSFYDLVHPVDLNSVIVSMRELFRKGHSRSLFYRLLGANGSVLWTQTEIATVKHTNRGQKGQYILCVHSILGTQSELESWNVCNVINLGETIISNTLENELEVQAAQPVKNNVKIEIPDVGEYFGLQPEFIDCSDFTPLIQSVQTGTVIRGDLSDYQPAERPTLQESQVLPNGVVNQFDSKSDQTRLTRNNSFDKVLQWLFQEDEQTIPQEQVSAMQNYHLVDNGIATQAANNAEDRRRSFESTFNAENNASNGAVGPAMLAVRGGSTITSRTPPRFGSFSRNSRCFKTQRLQQHEQFCNSRCNSIVLPQQAELFGAVAKKNPRPDESSQLDDKRMRYKSMYYQRKNGALPIYTGGGYVDGCIALLEQQQEPQQFSQFNQFMAERKQQRQLPQKSQNIDTYFNRVQQQNDYSVSTFSEFGAYAVPLSPQLRSNLHSIVPSSNCPVYAQNYEHGELRQQFFSYSPVSYRFQPQQQFYLSSDHNQELKNSFPYHCPQQQVYNTFNFSHSNRGSELHYCQQSQKDALALNVDMLPAVTSVKSSSTSGQMQFDKRDLPNQLLGKFREENMVKHLSNFTFNQKSFHDICYSLEECNQFGAQLAPFLPEDDMQNLLNESIPSIEEVNELFPHFDISEFFPADCANILPEIKFTDPVLAAKSVMPEQIACNKFGFHGLLPKQINSIESKFLGTEFLMKRPRFDEAITEMSLDGFVPYF